jgi:hypothetical protein
MDEAELLSSAAVWEKLFGPTADYLRDAIKNQTEKGLKNLGRIFDHAAKTLGGELEKPGQIPPKILRDVAYHGYVCEDELSAQYFGGVLASSRSDVKRDDRGSSFIQLIGRLSVYEIRSHYIFYTIFRRLCADESHQLGRFREIQKFTLFVPFEVWAIAMDLQPNEQQHALILHVMNGLSREDLIDGRWCAGGGPERIKELASIQVESDGIVFIPSAVGVELYLWAHGLGKVPASEFLVNQFTPIALDELVIPAGANRFIIPDRPLRNSLRDQAESEHLKSETRAMILDLLSK